MSKVQACLKNILSARYGKDVRQSIHDAIEELNAISVTAQGSASISAQTASTKASEANASKTSAAASAKAAEDAAARAVAVSSVGVASETVAGLMAGGDNMVDDSGALVLTRKTTDRTLIGSKDGGGVKINQIAGVSQQVSIPTPDVPQDIKSSVVSAIKAHNKNVLKIADATYTSLKTWGISLPAGTYTVSCDITSTDTDATQCLLELFVTPNNYSKYYQSIRFNRGKAVFTFTITETINSMYLWASTSGNGSSGDTVTLKNFMIVEGKYTADTIGDFEPYTEKTIQLSAPITLRGIGDVKDTICKQDGVYGVLRKIIHYNLGDLTWMIRTDITANNKYLYQTGNLPANVKESIGMCSITTNFTKDLWSATENVLSVNSNFLRMGLDTARITSATAENFKAWLAKNNAVADLILATPVFEPLPLADQIALHQLETFDAVTHILTDSAVEPVIECEYGTSFAGAYAIKGMNTAEANRLEIEQLKATTLSLSNALLESEV